MGVNGTRGRARPFGGVLNLLLTTPALKEWLRVGRPSRPIGRSESCSGAATSRSGSPASSDIHSRSRRALAYRSSKFDLVIRLWRARTTIVRHAADRTRIFASICAQLVSHAREM